MISIDPKILLGLVAGFVIMYILLLTRTPREGFVGGSDATGATTESTKYADIVTSVAAPNATNWVCHTYSRSGSESGAEPVIVRIGNDGYVECFNKDGRANTDGCSFMSRDVCTATLSELVTAGANQKELLATYVKKYNDPKYRAYNNDDNWLYAFCNANADTCIKAVKKADPNMVPRDKCGSYVPATQCASVPAPAAAQEPPANVKKFGRDATRSKPVLPTPSPSLNIPNLISTVRSLASQITGISTDSAEIRRSFVDAYGSAKTIPADDNNQIMLIYTSYTTFFQYFYSFLDDKNQRIFRNSPFEIQADMINLINQFDTHTLMVLLLTIDPNYEFETEEEVAAAAGAGAAAAATAGATTSTDTTSLSDISSIKESIIQDIKRTLKDVKCPPGGGGGGGGGSGGGSDPIRGGGASDPIRGGGASDAIRGGGSQVASKPGSLPLKDIFGPIGGGAGTGGINACTPTPTCEPAPQTQACQVPPTSCPVCSGTGCDVCAGSGSPSLGQGSNWYTMLPSNTKPTWTDETMMWGR